MDVLQKLYEMTAFGSLIENPGSLLMLAIGAILLYLGIRKQYEPLLLVPIAFGVILANLPGGGMGVVPGEFIQLEGLKQAASPDMNLMELEMEHRYMNLFEIAHEYGIMNFLYYMLIKTGLLPPIIFMGVGALTDFGPMLRNLRLSFFGAAAQLGIFTVLLIAILVGFTPKEAASLAIIGGADGPTAIYTTIKLAPHLLGPIAIAAYSYMALVPVIIPLVVKLTCSPKELKINMKQMDKLYPPKHQIKNLRAVKIAFPIVLGIVISFFVPSAVPLLGMLLFGNLIKEIGANTLRLSEAASGPIMNTATIFLGLTVGATMTSDVFLDPKTIGIIVGGFFAFAISVFGGIAAVKVFNLFTKKKINPLIGATGLSAVPMASRVANEIALKYDSNNHVLQYCMSSNISGVIGSAVAAGVLISFLS
ncbi:MAG TPA: sodium ion-translocating decarboxylase subunit beta [Prolixibacteraceae bacterium]|nr:sodium ion-translocating decarboxylase subunit beta [Bacteroidales bacterium]HQN93490.1 sodium ion-translocating decarboxylase subunit beta [Prolixibacteraceae bacterium]HUM88089.1 sodium ion-translocating decarboxylase subunit beta [Prolixibacteraceae bacterium]